MAGTLGCLQPAPALTPHLHCAPFPPLILLGKAHGSSQPQQGFLLEENPAHTSTVITHSHTFLSLSQRAQPFTYMDTWVAILGGLSPLCPLLMQATETLGGF